MYNVLISFGSAAAVFFALLYVVAMPWWISLLVALSVFAVVYVLIMRFVLKKLTAAMESAGKDLQAQRVEKAVRTLQDMLRYSPWQFSVAGQINSQIGMIYYLKRDFSNAFSYLEKSFAKNWIAMGMLAISYMKRNKKEKMRATFDKAVMWSSKESLLWNLYAYCLVESGSHEDARKVLERGLKKLPGDERIMQNLQALQDGKKMKMKSFGDMWLQFHLERQSVIMKQQAAAMGGISRRKIIRK
ncbi:MAG TPA: tetratricopeptide repeat protein [Geobacteraceae bacterium]|nr:tetratricopeptide repeat protein [Geobacteraceae bacterium]